MSLESFGTEAVVWDGEDVTRLAVEMNNDLHQQVLLDDRLASGAAKMAEVLKGHIGQAIGLRAAVCRKVSEEPRRQGGYGGQDHVTMLHVEEGPPEITEFAYCTLKRVLFEDKSTDGEILVAPDSGGQVIVPFTGICSLTFYGDQATE